MTELPRMVLLVEDQLDASDLLERLVRQAYGEADITTCITVSHALAQMDRRWSLALIDLRLLDGSGIDVLRRMRSHPVTCLVPVVVLTSSSEEEDMLDSYQAGANSYIRKPVGFSEFVEVVSGLGVYWLSYNEEPPRR